jgi:hypothetical protein
MLGLLVGFLIGAAIMWSARRAALRDYALQKWDEERASLKVRIDALEAAAWGVVDAADEAPWDPAMNALWHAVDRLVEALEREP